MIKQWNYAGDGYQNKFSALIEGVSGTSDAAHQPQASSAAQGADAGDALFWHHQMLPDPTASDKAIR
jgi:hypothetical protein